MIDIPVLRSGLTVPAALIYHSAIVVNADLFEVPSIMYVKAVEYTRLHHAKKGHPDNHTFCSWEQWAQIWGIPLIIKAVEYRNWVDFPDLIHAEISAFTNENNRVQTMILGKHK